MAKFAWNDENVSVLKARVEGVTLVSQDLLKDIADELGHTARGIGSKLRQLVKVGELSLEVQKASDANKSAWAEDEEAALVDFLNAHNGEMTYNEVAATFLAGKFSAKQIQGKVLSLEMTDAVKKAEKVAAKRTYTEAEEATFIEMANAGDSLEAIAEAMGRPLQSVRGKGLSLHREGRISEIPHQAESKATVRADWLEPVMDVMADLTVAEIAEKVGKSERGVKNALTRRGLACADHNGEKQRAKLDAKAEKAE
ncbi:D5 protein [Vibrio phage Thalassa]|uniref:D5 protein n=2 Tax=Thalassavirus TaxID=2948922 RepID=A0A2H5BGY5_9CAUD|nr:D5 protein [Vibrio phage Thalassa]YP_010107904.1 D5 protein [Vibrio phage River4]AUG85257.1 D5 protein [Vibrio phage Thalassa]QKN84718.1 D5 protein [Vibrio phage River4]